MTEWYYTDSQQQRHGPVSDEELIALHNRNLLTGDTLVWRDGLSGWKTWREMAPEVLGPATPEAPPVVVDDGAYRPYAVATPAPRPAAQPTASESPYAPPQARLQSGRDEVVRGGYVVYAGFWKRVAANFIDAFILGIVGGIIGAILGVGMAAGGGSVSRAEGIGNLLGVLLNILYFAGMQSSSTQASLGKMAVGIKVVTTDGEPLKFPHALVRQLAMYLNLLTLGIGLVIAGFTARKQALHDMLCGTLVVDKYAFTDEEDQQNESLGAVTIVVLVLFGLVILGAFAIGLFAAAALSGMSH